MEPLAQPKNFEIAPDYRVEDWNKLNLDSKTCDTPDWRKAIAIFDSRLRARFFEPAQFLIDAENDKKRGTYGFAVLAIDFLLIETIQGFKIGCKNHRGRSKELFTTFLSTWQAFEECVPDHKTTNDIAEKIYDQGRCALHHTGSTDRLVVKRSGGLFVFLDDETIEINRSLLHSELTKAFELYQVELTEHANSVLRNNFKMKMGHVVGD